MERQTAFTLIELLVALAVLAVLGTLAMPAFEATLLNTRRTAAMEELARAAWFARAEALRRGSPVLLCAAAMADACDPSPGDWTRGWRVAPADAPTETLRRGAGIEDPRARLLANRHAFRFEPHDRRSTNGTIAWCDRRGAGAASALVISPTGRPRLAAGPGSLACPPP